MAFAMAAATPTRRGDSLGVAAGLGSLSPNVRRVRIFSPFASFFIAPSCETDNGAHQSKGIATGAGRGKRRTVGAFASRLTGETYTPVKNSRHGTTEAAHRHRRCLPPPRRSRRVTETVP